MEIDAAAGSSALDGSASSAVERAALRTTDVDEASASCTGLVGEVGYGADVALDTDDMATAYRVPAAGGNS